MAKDTEKKDDKAAPAEASPEEAAEIQGTDAESLAIEPGPAVAEEEMIEPAQSPLYDPDSQISLTTGSDSSGERFEPGSAEAEAADQFGNIEDAGSPQNQSNGAGSREHPEEDTGK